ncbi:restriction endonuclease [Pseudomonas syringae pv. syringae]|uniref:BsuBI/PstI family type II restriction endonuclease n=1 Tax=Pseudomonas TaxID=286 RepID=UPI001F0F9692|nr:BsuBI/PstI family type II restriction endonuclease [Pseudomonas syringae]MCH5499537.1 restriction endonuclease [Pseudomonas syringae pv. syringae]MCH5525682.1 restriction endonuclease [Pseudomonas syringae pv. syringae]MCH5560778.1 restriction endonuclease [Pseudomonas syringae pv. syringae]MCH5566028.1 restriction endonuclease [Pseudomonas syringae pv. syringae]MCH5581302.1 restriction endonuclease [Pseudomonas syringae pv. syringae]
MLPPYVARDLVAERLPLIFPEGTPNRTYCTRELAASTVFTMLYIGAVEGSGVLLGPVHVYRMTDQQAADGSDEARHNYRSNLRKRNFTIPGKRWYADNTREPIRDETLREGLIAVGAVIEDRTVSTTAGAPRYALRNGLAALFAPSLNGDELASAILGWQKEHLNKGALARISLMRLGGTDKEGVLISFPNGETRTLAPGPSSEISRAVVEVFAKQFLAKPVVLWLSESSNKVAMQDLRMASSIGLDIEAQKNLPDLILVDLEPVHPLIVFVEVVATDGAITERRQEALFSLTDKGGFKRSSVAFVTAYADRQSPGFKKTISGLAWGSFAWFLSEPDKIFMLSDGIKPLSGLIEVITQQ